MLNLISKSVLFWDTQYVTVLKVSKLHGDARLMFIKARNIEKNKTDIPGKTKQMVF